MSNFSMHRENCERCHQPTNGVTIMSMYNEDVICMSCKENEKKKDDYKKAVDADIAEIKKGNYNFKGIGYKDTYEEAETACLIKLIEIVKNK